MRYYRIDLADLLTGALSWRRLGVLVRRLPPGSATERSQRGEAGEWGYVEHLLATVVDLLAGANWQRAGDKKVKAPKPIPRPGDHRSRSRLSPAEVHARLLDQRRKEG